MEDDAIYEEIDGFTLGGCVYKFPDKLGLNTLKLDDSPGYITVCRGFDIYFIGVGTKATSSVYDWQSKFHGYFQRFEIYGPSTEKEEELQELFNDVVDMDTYRKNRLYTKMQEGVVTGTRMFNLFPCSVQFKGSDKIVPVPDYSYIDPSFIVLEKGDRFRGLFEYSISDNELQRILYGEKV